MPDLGIESIMLFIRVCHERAMTRPKAAIIAVVVCLWNSFLYAPAPERRRVRRRLSTSFLISASCAFVKSAMIV